MTNSARAALVAVLLACGAAVAAPPTSVYLEELTSAELRERIAAGMTTVIVPVGGTEQNGPHLVLGKHNVRVRALAGRIAQRLGDAVVAPVVAYVPEGAIEPPSGHMRWAGTITVPEAAFEAVLESAAHSLRRHGLRHVVFVGDHGGTQRSLERVAARLERSARPGSGSAIALVEYYRAADRDFAAALAARGHAAGEIGRHAGLADTSLSLAVDPALVRSERLADAAGAGGVDGDPRHATAELGRLGVERIVDASVAVIRQRTLAR